MAAWCFFAPCLFAQEGVCDELAPTVGSLSTSPDLSERSTLETLAREAMRAHEACRAEPQRRRTVYALNQAVFALDGLARYVEADSLVDLYYRRYANDDAYQDEGESTFFRVYRARFAAWRSRFAMLQGDFLSAAHTNGQGEAFTDALPLSRQIHLRLDLAYLYEQEERHTQALAIIDSIQAEHGEVLRTDSILKTTYARVLLEGGELLGKQARNDSTNALTSEQITQLEEAEQRLEQSIELYAETGERVRRAEATVILGDARSTLRNSPDYLSIALDSARAWSAHRSVVYGLWRRGRYFLRDGESRKAEIDFLEGQALSDSIGLGEFDRYLALDLGRAFEDQGKLDEARTAFEQAHRLSVGLLGARWREEAQRHLRSIDRRESRRMLRDFGVGVMLLLVFIAGLLYTIHRQRRALIRFKHTQRAPTAPPNRPALPARPRPTGIFARRYGYACDVLLYPEDVAPLIDDPILKGYLMSDGVSQVGELHEAVAALVLVRDRKKVDPAAVARMFQRHFPKHGWTVPETIDAWKKHIDEHPPDSLTNT